MNTIIEKLKSRVIIFCNTDTEDCLNYPYLDQDGYGSIQYSLNRKHGHYRAHRLVYEIVNNRVLLSEELILHKCDNPACCNPKHLFVGTHNDNVQDKVNKNRQAKGKKNGRYKTGYFSIYEPTQKSL